MSTSIYLIELAENVFFVIFVYVELRQSICVCLGRIMWLFWDYVSCQLFIEMIVQSSGSIQHDLFLLTGIQ